MKKVYLLFVAATLAACSAEQIETEGRDSLDAALAGKNNVKASEAVFEGLEVPGFETISFDLINSKNNKLKGKVFVSNDCNNVYFKIEGAEEFNLGIYTDQTDFPVKNGAQETVSPEQSITAEDYPDMTYSLPVGTLKQIYVFVNAGGHSWGGDEEWGTALYFSYELQLDSCSTLCSYGKGYWWNHSPNGNPGNQENAWPEDFNGLTLGGTFYSNSELGKIFDRNSSGGNSIVQLAHKLIVVELNLANGLPSTPEVEDAIAEANEYFEGKNLLEDFSKDDDIESIKNILTSFIEANECDEE